MIVYDAAGSQLSLNEEIGRGSEAAIFTVQGRAEQVAKLYHTYRPEYEEKLRWMITHPPVLAGGAPVEGVAWPQRLLYSAQARFIGFQMPRLHPARPLAWLWRLPWEARLHAAHTLAQTVAGLHAQGYVLGALGTSEVMLLPTPLLVLVDADAYQIRVPHLVGSTLYLAQVGHPAYTPPERQGQREPADLSPSHDHFALALLLFQMLLEGVHPFEGREAVGKASVPLAEAIVRGAYPHAGSRITTVAPPAGMLPLDTLHPALVALFERCFVEGHQSPRQRPTPTEWAGALAVAKQALRRCQEGHYFPSHLPICAVCRPPRRAEARATPPAQRPIPKHWRGAARARQTVPVPSARPHRSRSDTFWLLLQALVVITYPLWSPALFGLLFDSPAPSVPRTSRRPPVYATAPAPVELARPAPTFGMRGMMITDLGGSDGGNALLLQPDGKLIVAAWSEDDPALVRYLPDGLLDFSFGTYGAVVTDFGPDVARIAALALQPDGKIVVAGQINAVFALARYTSDGRLDESFGEGGLVLTPFRDFFSSASAVVVQPDGRIVVAGIRQRAQNGAVMVRYEADGTLDASFGTEGRAMVPTVIESKFSRLILQPDGKLVAGGYFRLLSSAESGFLLARYDSQGVPDPTFGEDGMIKMQLEQGASRMFDLALQPDGKLLASGLVWHKLTEEGALSTRFVLVRYESDGQVDKAFGAGPTANPIELMTDPYGNYPRSQSSDLVLGPDGSIFVMGTVTNDKWDSMLLHYFENGFQDTGFGVDGRLVIPATEGFFYDFVMHPDSGLIAVGMVNGNVVLKQLKAPAP